MSDTRELLDAAVELKTIMVTRATSTAGTDDRRFGSLRDQLVSVPSLKPLIPECVKVCRTSGEFWAYIQPKFKSYAERREFLRTEFASLLDRLEAGAVSPIDTIPEALKELSWDGVHTGWNKALERRSTDPEGAITAARTLLETVCKHILEELGVAYEDDGNLPKLYKLTASQMKLSPSQHTEDVFKKILGGCQAVVEGLGSLRNQVGDAHGQGKKRVKPSSRHAELAVNLAGAMATFLVETWLDRKQNSKS